MLLVFVVTQAQVTRNVSEPFLGLGLQVSQLLEPHIEYMTKLSVHFAQNEEVLVLPTPLKVFIDFHDFY